MVTDPLAGSQLEEECAVETTHGPVIDVLDGGGLAQLGTAGAGLEALLPAVRHLVFEDQRQPLGIAQRDGGGIGLQSLEALGATMQTEGVESFQGGMGQHRDAPQW